MSLHKYPQRRHPCIFLVLVISILFPRYSIGETNDYVHYQLGLKYKNEQKFEQAIIEFRKVLTAYPDHYNTYMHIAEIYEHQKRYRLASYNLNKALSYNPGWGKAKKMLSLVYEKDGQYPNAIKELQEYQQYCDPAERDSIQTTIDRLITVMKEGKPKEKKKVSLSPRATDDMNQSEVNQDPNASKLPSKLPDQSSNSSKNISKKVTNKTLSPQVQRLSTKQLADQEFKAGVIAYSEGISADNQELLVKALQHFRNTLKYNSAHAGAYYYAGLIRRKNGQNEMAKTNFKNSISYPDLGLNAHFYLGKMYGEEKKYSLAINQLQLYIKKTSYEPGKAEAQSLIDRYSSILQSRNADTVKIDIVALGTEALHKEVSKIPEQVAYKRLEITIDSLLSMVIVDTLTDPGQSMLQGVKLFRDAKFDEAIQSFREVLLQYPNGEIAAQCLYDIGVCYMKLKNYSSGINKFQQILDRHRSSSIAPKSLFLKALALYEKHDLKNAEKIFRSFIQKHRKHMWAAKAYEKLGDIYHEMLGYKKAVEAYSQASKIATTVSDRSISLSKLGNAYSQIQNSTRAINAYKRVISLGEKEGSVLKVPESYYAIADIRYKGKNYSDALKYYADVSRKFPNHPDTPWGLFQIGSIYKNIKEYKRAISAFNTVIQKFPDNYWATQAQWKKEDTMWEYEYRSVLK